MSLSCPLFQQLQLFKIITWHPLTLNTGISYLYNGISIPFSLSAGIPLSYDADGPGPSPTISGNAEIDFTPNVCLSSRTFAIPITVMTTINAGWFLILDIGFGLDFLVGKAYIAVDDDAEIAVTGEMAAYELTPGHVTITGTINENSPDIIRFKLLAAIGFRIDPVWIKIPVAYYFDYGICMGIEIGIQY
jgi:hypothetical protein